MRALRRRIRRGEPLRAGPDVLQPGAPPSRLRSTSPGQPPRRRPSPRAGAESAAQPDQLARTRQRRAAPRTRRSCRRNRPAPAPAQPAVTGPAAAARAARPAVPPGRAAARSATLETVTLTRQPPPPYPREARDTGVCAPFDLGFRSWFSILVFAASLVVVELAHFDWFRFWPSGLLMRLLLLVMVRVLRDGLRAATDARRLHRLAATLRAVPTPARASSAGNANGTKPGW